MYNLNVNVNANPGAATAAAGLLSVAADGTTPRTPDIVNSLIAMTNPFDGYVGQHADRGKARNDSSSSGEPSPPSIQTTCSQLIKEGLKLTLQTKRRANGSSIEGKKRARKEDGSADDEEDDESSNSKTNCELTPEDEERRRRRRERNKIAATKCRLKKREKTVILVQESETLESQNHTLKSQIQQLETERRELVDMLQMHRSTCLKQQANNATDAQAYQQYADQPVGPLPSYQDNFLTSGSNNPAAASDCAIVADYGPVKVDSFEAGDFFSQHSCAGPFAAVASTTTTATTMSNASDAGCTV